MSPGMDDSRRKILLCPRARGMLLSEKLRSTAILLRCNATVSMLSGLRETPGWTLGPHSHPDNYGPLLFPAAVGPRRCDRGRPP